MKRSALIALALAASAAAGSALADTHAYVAVQNGAPVYVEHYDRDHDRWDRGDRYAYDSREDARHWRREECRAARWDPNARYMPGQAVWRNGQLYVATEVSRHVWNVNSPPEWTPNYWQPAQCR